MTKRDMDYLVGAYLGDGTYYNKYGIRFTVAGSDEDYADVLMDLLKDYHPIKTKEKTGVIRVVAGNKEKPLAHYFCCKKTNRQQDKSKNGVWGDISSVRHFDELIAGLIDTDGSVRDRGAWKQNYKKNIREITFSQRHKSNIDKVIPIMEELYLYPSVGKKMTYKDGRELYSISIAHWTQVEIFKRMVKLRHPRKAKILAYKWPPNLCK